MRTATILAQDAAFRLDARLLAHDSTESRHHSAEKSYADQKYGITNKKQKNEKENNRTAHKKKFNNKKGF